MTSNYFLADSASAVSGTPGEAWCLEINTGLPAVAAAGTARSGMITLRLRGSFGVLVAGSFTRSRSFLTTLWSSWTREAICSMVALISSMETENSSVVALAFSLMCSRLCAIFRKVFQPDSSEGQVDK